MSTIVLTNHTLLPPVRKRAHVEESTVPVSTKKPKSSLDVTSHWKKIHNISEKNTAQAFECQSKNDYLTMTDPLGDRSRFVVSKSSSYWLNESIRLMQQRVEYGTTMDAAALGELLEIERHLKALKANVEKGGTAKTFFSRAEALVNFVRLCCTFFDSPVEKYRRRLQALFNLCASGWLHMLDGILPTSVVRVEQSFLLDEDYGDFENDTILRYFRKNDQMHIKKTNIDVPNVRHLLYSILLIVGKLREVQLIDRAYLERFEMIYQIWTLIDNELNRREKTPPSAATKRKTTADRTQRVSWDFLNECQKYEKTYGELLSHAK